MENESDSSTVLLNQYKNDGFLDFYSSSDFKEVMRILNEIMED